MEKILIELIKLIPESTKNKIARWLENKHPLLWEQAKENSK